jgi:redox-sensitive bicupin YhaK (pirin superfamily)
MIQAMAVSEGAGVTVHRTIGTPALRNLDPFLMLDHFSSDDPDDYIAGFPDHPHRGFNTFTYMLEGHMLHQDSMGNKGDLRAGGAQWMKAASGVIHSEMPQQTAGMMRGFQLWINLPASAKMSEPAYQEFSPEAFPVVKDAQARVKILIGEYRGQQGPISDPYTDVQYLDISVNANAGFSHPLHEALQGFVYVFEGDARIGETALPQHSFAVLGEGDSVQLVAGEKGARFILVAGRPLHEPIVQYGPFVMNSPEEIQQAFIDYREGKLVREKAAFHTA